jgi:hypothetical protein
MAEYIKREALVHRLKSPYLFNITQRIFEIISEIPAADVAPVVHGEWLLRHEGYGHYWECSVCHTNPCIYVTEHTKFCPNCGAIMDGGNSDAAD